MNSEGIKMNILLTQDGASVASPLSLKVKLPTHGKLQGSITIFGDRKEMVLTLNKLDGSLFLTSENVNIYNPPRTGGAEELQKTPTVIAIEDAQKKLTAKLDSLGGTVYDEGKYTVTVEKDGEVTHYSQIVANEAILKAVSPEYGFYLSVNDLESLNSLDRQKKKDTIRTYTKKKTNEDLSKMEVVCDPEGMAHTFTEVKSFTAIRYGNIIRVDSWENVGPFSVKNSRGTLLTPWTPDNPLLKKDAAPYHIFPKAVQGPPFYLGPFKEATKSIELSQFNKDLNQLTGFGAATVTDGNPNTLPKLNGSITVTEDGEKLLLELKKNG
eukprot:Platyproteum_vivax@DN1699_c0_g1_i1.p1